MNEKLNDRIADILSEHDEETLEAGIELTQLLLCRILGVNPDDVSWDAATETFDGDLAQEIGSILEVAFGEDYDPAEIRARTALHGSEGE